MTLADEAGWTAPMATAVDLIRQHRDQVLAYTGDSAGDEHPRAGLTRPGLPPAMARLVEQYENGHPGVRLEPLRFVSVDPAGHHVAVAEDASLPPETELVSLSLTEAVVDADRIEVRCQILLAARGRSGGA